ncbi:long-chain-fatty-acid--CoA ligase [Desulfotomaculum copahuensis]|uniref:Acyl-CoA synthetase n=1 Tax=Desulfotomaculum copahuensis TaxID=1838280 RepID=A0A1B7LGX5_9FIRM|nr:long-chain-fatty-acid--CoA ligase [Desulfotomaculum copahuensis]OAT85456.1 acyl-CoA synthetase [Desulfotomaculum copahuensis]
MTQRTTYYEPLSPLSFLKRSAFVYPDKTAVVYKDKRYTYSEFYQRVNRLASALSRVGVGKGDKVAFICPNTPPMLEAHYAVPMLGAALVSVNIRLSPAEVAYILNHSDSKAVFVDNEFAHIVAAIKDQLPNIKTFVNICDVDDSRPLDGLEYEEFLATGSPDPRPNVIEDEMENITINYTSGTTGLPKGVMYHHRGAYMNALGEALEHLMSANSVYLWTLPMFHCNGWCYTWGVTAVGATHVCLRKVVPEEIYRLVEEEGVTHLCAAPTVLVSMANYPKARECKMKTKLKVITAGAPPAPTVIKNMEAIGAEVTQVYGLTEVYGPHTICEWRPEWNALPVDERAAIKARQGVAYITSEFVKVVDVSNMEEVPYDGQTLGEIVMRGNNVMLGYYKQPEDTERAFRGGWFHSGDLAVVHPNGYIEIKDRIKDIIISGGENISTVEVENCIYQHPDVLEVAVIAVPDPKWGEVPKAFVVPKPGTNPTVEEIINFCRERIARFKVPKAIEFGELPKTSTGKIMKYRLREKEWSGHEKRVN